jgi:hypothetical protein
VEEHKWDAATPDDAMAGRVGMSFSWQQVRVAAGTSVTFSFGVRLGDFDQHIDTGRSRFEGDGAKVRNVTGRREMGIGDVVDNGDPCFSLHQHTMDTSIARYSAPHKAAGIKVDVKTNGGTWIEPFADCAFNLRASGQSPPD